MKNKKGFTLVELLAVVVLLSILMIITITNIQRPLSSTKNALSSLEKANIEEAAKQAVTEILTCDLSDSTYDLFNLASDETCTTAKEKIIDQSIEISVDDLIVNKYFTDDAKQCEGDITITTDENYSISVDTSEVKCITSSSDTYPPKMTLITTSGITGKGIIRITDQGKGLSSTPIKIYYAWSTSAVSCSEMTNYITITPEKGASKASETISISDNIGIGKLYVCNKEAIFDDAGNSIDAGNLLSGSVNIDNTYPEITVSTTSSTAAKATLNITCTDEETGIDSLNATCSGGITCKPASTYQINYQASASITLTVYETTAATKYVYIYCNNNASMLKTTRYIVSL
jgi:prepilin-type N-terminal cleavage/methylation domain-containing protein